MLELLQGQAIATPDSEVVEEKAAPKPCRSQTQKNTPINVDKLDDSHSKKEKAPIPLDELSKNPSKATQGSRSVSGVGSETEGETEGGGLPMDVGNPTDRKYAGAKEPPNGKRPICVSRWYLYEVGYIQHWQFFQIVYVATHLTISHAYLLLTVGETCQWDDPIEAFDLSPFEHKSAHSHHWLFSNC